MPFSMPSFQDLGVGNEQIVAHQLDFVAQNFGLVSEARPVGFIGPSSIDTIGYCLVRSSRSE